MIVVCVCGQANRVKASVATGGVTAKDVKCGSCKVSIRKFIEEQADRNSHIVFAICKLFEEADPEKTPEDEIVAIFGKNGMDLLAMSASDESDTDDDEDEDDDDDTDEDEEDEDEPVVPSRKKVTKKVQPKAKKKKKPVGRTH